MPTEGDFVSFGRFSKYHGTVQGLWLLMSVASLTACTGKRDAIDVIVDPVAPTPTPTPTPDPAELSTCSSKVIDAGVKNNTVAAYVRGVYSDTKLQPGTNFMASAFNDLPGAATAAVIGVKFTWYNGSKNVTEFVSGEANVRDIRLAFLSDKTPIIFYASTLASNAQVRAAFRSQALPETGTWNVVNLDSTSALQPRALEVAVSPNDQVLVNFINTTTAGDTTVIVCNSGCKNAGNYSVVLTPDSAQVANASIAATGAAWCQDPSTAELYLPAVAYAAAVGVRYAVCTQSNLALCATESNWVKWTLGGATTAINIKLVLDSTIPGDIPKVMAFTSAGYQALSMSTGSCIAAGTNSSGTAIAAAGLGNSWATVLKDNTGKFHMAANLAATNVKYYNTIGGGGNTFTGAWGTSLDVETTTLHPAASANGSAFFNQSKDAINVVYGKNVANAYTLRLMQVGNIGVAATSSIVSPMSAIDTTGAIQLAGATAPLQNIAMATTSSGRPAIVYIDYSVGATANAKLKIAVRESGGSSAYWSVSTILDAVTPMHPSIAFDEDDIPYISYFDAAGNRYVLLQGSRTDGQGSWAQHDFPHTVLGVGVAPMHNQTAVVMVGSTDKTPVMIIADSFTTGARRIRAARFTGSFNPFSTPVDIEALSTGGVGGLSAASDANGNIAVAYHHIDASGVSSARVKYSSSANGITWTAPIGVSANAQGEGLTLRFSPFNNQPRISYFDKVNNWVLFAKCESTATGCATGSWSNVKIDEAAGVSGLSANQIQLLSSYPFIDRAGNPFVLYPRGIGSGGNLIINRLIGTTWSASTMYSGVNSSFTGINPATFGVAGWNIQASMNEANSATMAYIGPGNWLYVTSCGD
jgi:hypothetical protein